MKLNNLLSVIILGSVLLFMVVPSSDGKNNSDVDGESKGALQEVSLQSRKLPVNGLTKHVELPWKTPSGKIEKRIAQVVIVPENGIIWVGLPNSHCLVVGDSIWGFSTLHAGILLCRVSTNKLDIAGQLNDDVKTIGAKLNGYLRNVDGQDITLNPKDTEIALDRIVGLGALMDLNRAEAAPPPTILRAEFLGEEIAITLRSGIGRIIRLVLSRARDPISAQVDGKIVFEKGRTPAPTIEQEFKRDEQIEKAPKQPNVK